MKSSADLVHGDFANETEFKAKAIPALNRMFPGYTWFRIETEETVAGFPDVLGVPKEGSEKDTRLVEMKLSDKDRVITFKKSQPLFYRQNLGLNIRIWAWDSVLHQVFIFTAAEIVDYAALKITLPQPEGTK